MDQVMQVFQDKMQVIKYTWVAIQIWAFAFVISAIAAAADSDSGAFKFDVIWLALLQIGYSVGGTMIISGMKYRKPLYVGVLMGVTFMMCMQYLMTSVLAGGNVGKLGVGDSPSSEKSVTAFGVLLFLTTGALFGMLVMWRDILAPDADQPMASDGNFDDEHLGGGGGMYDAPLDQGRAAAPTDVHVGDGAPSVL